MKPERWDILFRTYPANSAPSTVLLSDFTHVGSVWSGTKQQILYYINQYLQGIKVKSLNITSLTRQLTIGDVIVNKSKETFIYTENGCFATVKVINDL